MSFLTRTLRASRTITRTSTITPRTVVASRSYATGAHPIDPNDPRVGKNSRDELVTGPGAPEDFKNPNSGSAPLHEHVSGKTHAKDGGNDSVVPKGTSASAHEQSSHANSISEAAQKLVPESVERALPNSIHNTGSKPATSTTSEMSQSADAHADAAKKEAESTMAKYGIGKTHAKDDGNDSYVPKVIQKAVPKAVEDILPDAIHNTGSSKKN
jgi:hypothetical protein